MSNRKCSVPGCVNSIETQVPLHKFPNPAMNKELFNTWVYSIGGDILRLENNHIFKYRRVCHVHFKEKYWCRNNRITKDAVPTINMPGKPAVESSHKEVLPVNEESSCSMLPVTDKCTGITALEHDCGPHGKKATESSSDHNRNSTQVELQPILDLPSESNQSLTGSSDHDTSTQVFESEPILDLLSESNQYLTGALDITLAKTSLILKSNNKSFRDEPSASRQTETESKYHRPIPPLIVNQLQTARKRVKQLQSEVIRLRKRNKVVTTKLINAKNNSKHNCLQKITQNMTAAAKIFTRMQFTQTQKRSRGRRFTLEGHRLCHSIYKCSPQCYDLLSKVFTLPSAKTLKRLMRKQELDIQPGVSNGLNEGPMQPVTF